MPGLHHFINVFIIQYYVATNLSNQKFYYSKKIYLSILRMIIKKKCMYI